jgi:hypothetical protein
LLIFCSRVNCNPSNSMASMTIKLLLIVPTRNYLKPLLKLANLTFVY